MFNRITKLGKGVSAGISIISSLKGSTCAVLAWAENRLALLALEVEEEKLRLISLLLTAISALFFFGFGLLFGVAALAFLFWETHKEVVLGGVSLVFLLAGALCLLRLHKQSRKPSVLFSASIKELKKDQQAFSSDEQHD